MTLSKCPICGQISLTEMHGAYCFEPPKVVPGGPILVANASWLHCDSCAEDILPAMLEEAIDEERRRRLGLLAPVEIRQIREKTCLSVQDMSNLLGVSEDVYERWENGCSLPTAPVNALFRQIAENPGAFAARATHRGASRG